MTRSDAPTGAGRRFLPLAAALWLSACVFDRLQQSEEADVKRVEDKEAALQTEKERSAELEPEEARLAAELGERLLTLNELNDRVQAINATNGRAILDNDASRARYRALLAQVHDTNAELMSVQTASAASIEERREHIDVLQHQIKIQLDELFRAHDADR